MRCPPVSYLGVDGCPGGWVAVCYGEDAYRQAGVYAGLEELWRALDDEETMLVDVPIGLREDSGEPRACDRAARQVLGHPRSASVFPTPVRAVLQAETYEQARGIQEARTGASVPAPTWGIVDRLREADRFARDHPEALSCLHEAHPEVCFWALSEHQATEFSKTGQPAAALVERIGILEQIDPDVAMAVRQAARGLDAAAGMDDVLDAFALAISASPLTGPLVFLPDHEEEGAPHRDPRGLAMQIAYARPR